MTKREYDYIRLNKRITNSRTIGGIRDFAKENCMTDQEACYHAINELAAKQNAKRLKNAMLGGLKQ